MANVIVVGATGLVGETIRKILEERNFPVDRIKFLASAQSAGKKIEFKGKNYEIAELKADQFASDDDYAFFAVSADLAAQYVPIAAEKGIRVIDNSSHFRQVEGIPLVVPEVNSQSITEDDRIIANPNCSTIQCIAPLYLLDQHYGIKRVVYSSYQSVSGSGLKGLKDLAEGTHEAYVYPIRDNILPHIGDFLDNGYTSEEIKMIQETKKILNNYDIKVTATTARVPVPFSHSVSINVELKKDFDLEEVRSLFNDPSYGLSLVDEPSQNIYPYPTLIAGKDDILVGRVRRDDSLEYGLNLWTVADNIRKGAALNAVQIAEKLLERSKY
ncbi:aspartate-semialdehyde dehydrogenase [Atopobacter sp. AH10]|uniref:aspartate-semialdehyde dehydrogenase n=1 Tax=Atopobacter sp. AH10 TaxID=2315861 RepID=UPI000EF1B37C|nr:aspartate-semialdehyde dehydrogenase [Atopobacter sp. AH10]RLK62703.1 aspartate-semialdehyde dehydrogenase [Atopobacter sp. AH10]